MKEKIQVQITHRHGYDQVVTTGGSFDDMEALAAWVVSFIGPENVINIEFQNGQDEQPEEVDSLTGISATVFTLPDGRDLPELKWENEGWELRQWLREIDHTMNDVGRWNEVNPFGENYSEWHRAWTDEFFRIRKAMGIFDPYSQTF
jgi:hypothetical protein